MEKPTDLQLNDLWSQLVMADARSRYFSDLAARESSKERAIAVLASVLCSGAAFAALGEYSEAVKGLAVVGALASAVTATFQFGKSSLRIGSLALSWQRVHREYKEIWQDQDAGEIGRPELRERMRILSARTDEVDAAYEAEGLREKTKLLNKHLDVAESCAEAELIEVHG